VRAANAATSTRREVLMIPILEMAGAARIVSGVYAPGNIHG
jgi:hypothetical protein